MNSVFMDMWNEHTTESNICAQARAIIATKTKEQKQNHVSNLKMVYENYAYDLIQNLYLILRELGDVGNGCVLCMCKNTSN